MGDLPIQSKDIMEDPIPSLLSYKKTEKKSSSPKLSLLPLVFLIFYEVSGGPFGIEDCVEAGGPFLSILGFIVFPLIWSIPEAFITAEMGTMFPENGGYVVWITQAFGPFWGFQQGLWKWLSGVIDNALYPLLFLDYLKFVVPSVSEGPIRVVSVILITAVLTYLNYRGLTVVGWASVGLGCFSLIPFLIMSAFALPMLDPHRWLSGPGSNWLAHDFDLVSVDWTTYLNTLFWNLNYWDSVSTLVGEVNNPHKTLPRALLLAVLLVMVVYLVPLLAGIGAIEVVRSEWKDGYFAKVALIVGGQWLGWWIEIAAALSNMGMFEAEMSSDSFQILGMAECGMLPAFLASKSPYGTPTLGILASATGILLLSWLSFQEIIVAENYLYCFGMLVEFAAFIWLRIFHPNIHRPYRVPLGTVGIICMCIPPTALLVCMMVFATWKVTIISLVVAIFGFAMYPCLALVKQKDWVRFVVNKPNVDDDAHIHLMNGEK